MKMSLRDQRTVTIIVLGCVALGWIVVEERALFLAITGLLFAAGIGIWLAVRQTKAARDNAKRQLHNLIAQLPCPILMVDDDRKITAANIAAHDLLGYEANQLCNISVHAVLSSLAYDGVCDASRHGGDTISVKVQLISEAADNGRSAVLALVPAKQDETYPADGGVPPNRQAVDQFSQHTSVNLRYRIRQIGTMVQGIQKNVMPHLPDSARADLCELWDTVQRLDRSLLNRMNNAQIDGNAENTVAVDLAELLFELIDLYVPPDRFEVRVPEDLPIVSVPYSCIELVFRNLLANAVQHHNRALGVIQVDWSLNEQGIAITLTDDGPGIPEADQDKVFDPLCTQPPTESGATPGLGLAVVRKTMTALGGEVRLVPGHTTGTSVELVLPADVVAMHQFA